MDKIEAKQKLFEIIKKNQQGKANESDIKLFCDIILNNNPYVERISTFKYVFRDIEKNGNNYIPAKTEDFNGKQRIVINNFFVEDLADSQFPLISCATTLFHESRHVDQFELGNAMEESEENKQKIEKSQQAKEIVDALYGDYSPSQKTLKHFIMMFGSAIGDEYKNLTNEQAEEKAKDLEWAFYISNASEIDARRASFRFSYEFLKQIYNDKDADQLVKAWVKTQAPYLKEEIDNEIRDDNDLIKLHETFTKAKIPFDMVLKIRDVIYKDLSKDEIIKTKTGVEKPIEKRKILIESYNDCLDYLFRDKNINELIEYYSTACLTPSMLAAKANVDNNTVSLDDYGCDFLTSYLEYKIRTELKVCSEQEKELVSSKILSIAKNPIVINNNSSIKNLSKFLTKQDFNSLITESICSFSTETNFIKKNIPDSFQENNAEDKILVNKILQTYKNHFKVPFDSNLTDLDKVILVKKSKTLENIVKHTKIKDLMIKFGYEKDFEEVLNREDIFKNDVIAKIEFDDLKEKYDFDSTKAIFGDKYAKIYKAQNKEIKIEDYNTDEGFEL